MRASSLSYIMCAALDKGLHTLDTRAHSRVLGFAGGRGRLGAAGPKQMCGATPVGQVDGAGGGAS